LPTPPRRKRFQIHLSTAVVMMVGAGALIWGNVNNVVKLTQEQWGENYEWGANLMAPNPEFALLQRGWPFPIQRWYSPRPSGISQPWILWEDVLVNLCVGAILLFASWFVCER